MDYKEYIKELGKMSGRRQNQIIYAVNCKLPKEDADLKTECESMFYDRLVEQAKEHEQKYGKWPVFDNVEIESDDPALDIYGDQV